ncbi:MAG TPA: hypothetical protein VLG40_03365 [Candidatus Saccharimonas sp.]|nr:hypothetical protein [Candidatus Saccharimonas sp.]
MLKSRRSRWIAACVVFVLAVCGGVTWWQLNSPPTATIAADGGTVWDDGHGVGVRIAPGITSQATTITFAVGESHPKTPLDQLSDPISDSIDITPSQNIAGKSQVLFKVPYLVGINADCTKTGAAAAAQGRSICNAGIEVYNTAMQGWVPLPTSIENGNTLVADAPHYSEYRAAWAKIGDVTLSTMHNLQTHFASDTTLIGIAGSATKAFFGQFFNNLTGHFDAEEKLAPCEKSPDSDFTVNFQQPNDSVKPCVAKQGSAVKLLVGDANAIPVAVSTTQQNGIAPDRNTESELTTAIRNKIAEHMEGPSGSKVVIVSGLDVGTFTIDPDHVTDKNGTFIDSIPLQTSNSWWAVGGDYLTAVLALFFPEERVASQVDKLVDAADCMGTGFTKIPGMAAGNIPAQLAEVIKACLVPAGIDGGVLKKISVPEIVGMFAKLPKLIPESFQIGENISTYLRTGHGKGDSAFTVVNQAKALVGKWINQCAGRDDAIDILGNGKTSSWIEVELGSNGNQVYKYETQFSVETEEGKTSLIIESTQQPTLHDGQKLALDYKPAQDGYSATITVGGNENWFFWNDNGGRSPC